MLQRGNESIFASDTKPNNKLVIRERITKEFRQWTEYLMMKATVVLPHSLPAHSYYYQTRTHHHFPSRPACVGLRSWYLRNKWDMAFQETTFRFPHAFTHHDHARECPFLEFTHMCTTHTPVAAPSFAKAAMGAGKDTSALFSTAFWRDFPLPQLSWRPNKWWTNEKRYTHKCGYIIHWFPPTAKHMDCPKDFQ